ncbi:transketolase [Candidatus Magnetomonas plexicatena]|uniref:transketolase n=1 Tax=Candidatus Magnetomonas plexicatena TaxID=2552947 RepID=UPI001C75960B|nr:transketolase [Nitrospirales bacterium LBB_01]
MLSCQKIREIIITQSKRANVGHIGCALSVADILAVLYGEIIRIDSFTDTHRDRFILSKGHAALALYAVFYLKGWITEQELNTFYTNNTLLAVHPESAHKCVDFSTGSLGQGITFGVGAALAAKMKKSAHRSFVLVSDGECNEGALWEAVMFAAHNRLSNLVVIVDLNGLQALGHTKDIISLEPLSEKWRSFGWNVIEVDGHDTAKMKEVIESLDTLNGPPHVIVADTIFGKGVSFMENNLKWHYMPMTDEEFKSALAEITK